MGGVDNSDPGIAIFPIISHLRLPGKIAGFVYVIYFQLGYHIPVVDIQYNQGFDCASVKGGDVRSGYFYNLRQLEV